jgi:hypothetical protein
MPLRPESARRCGGRDVFPFSTTWAAHSARRRDGQDRESLFFADFTLELPRARAPCRIARAAAAAKNTTNRNSPHFLAQCMMMSKSN